MYRTDSPDHDYLVLENVIKAYGTKTVLDDIDLAVHCGELCTLVGPSGCGKSTLLRLLLGQEFPTSGTITLKQEPLGYTDIRRGIVYQRYSLFPHLTVLENVALGRRIGAGLFLSRARKREIRDEAMEFLGRTGMADHGGKFPYELSGGMQQRVAIAQALVMRPSILLMDEPFGALDPGTRETMQVFLLELWEENRMTVFFVTHDLEEAVFLGTRILVLSQHYTDGRGPDFPRGARIVADYKLNVASTRVKESSDFGEFVARIRHEGFDPAYRRHVDDFNLKHPDSFQTLTEIEKRR